MKYFCVGIKGSGMSTLANILSDLGIRFNSPFVNLWVKPKDFIKILSDFDKYMSAELVEIKEESINYPIGKLLDVTIYF